MASSPLKKPTRRTQYIINQPFQYSFIGRMVALGLAVLAVVYTANFLFFWNLANKAMEKGIPKGHIFFRFIDEQQGVMNMIFAGAALVIFCGICIFGVLYSNRIAGPLYRLRQHLLLLASGKPLAEVKFRKEDYFLELAEAFNSYVSSQKPHKASPPVPFTEDPPLHQAQ